ncbi:uncharacterized protein ACOB7L_014732 isoform 1-T1 [Callospermophilus lateralis]|uniref:uncharacterized protein LOC143398590 n=1 Tax=Callospermophilus lateralis TaxID=76772 RepID=UPI00405435EB
MADGRLSLRLTGAAAGLRNIVLLPNPEGHLSQRRLGSVSSVLRGPDDRWPLTAGRGAESVTAACAGDVPRGLTLPRDGISSAPTTEFTQTLLQLLRGAVDLHACGSATLTELPACLSGPGCALGRPTAAGQGPPGQSAQDLASAQPCRAPAVDAHPQALTASPAAWTLAAAPLPEPRPTVLRGGPQPRPGESPSSSQQGSGCPTRGQTSSQDQGHRERGNPQPQPWGSCGPLCPGWLQATQLSSALSSTWTVPLFSDYRLLLWHHLREALRPHPPWCSVCVFFTFWSTPLPSRCFSIPCPHSVTVSGHTQVSLADSAQGWLLGQWGRGGASSR